jgi:uncharacterized protein HemX
MAKGSSISTSTFQGVANMQTALSLRKSPINSIAATFTIVLALTAGAGGGYWLKSQAAAVVTTAGQPTVAGASGQAAAPHDMPEYAAQSSQVPLHDMPEQP